MRALRRAAGAALLAWVCGSAACGPGPEPAPEADALVFVRRLGSEPRAPRDLAWVRIADGRGEVLETPEREESWPTWSPFVGQVAFVRGAQGLRRGRLWLWDPATGTQRSLTDVANRWESWPAWAERAPRIAYVHSRRGVGGVERLDLATGERVSLAASAGPTDRYLRPSLSPDGSWGLAQRVRPVPGREALLESDLYLVRPGALPEPLLTDPSTSDEKPALLRDGRTVVFARQPPEGGPSDLLQLDLASRTVRVLVGDPGTDDHTPAASPTRDEIAFVREDGRHADLWLLALDTGALHRLTSTPDVGEYAPHWSPDGERLAVTIEPGGDGASYVRVIDRAGVVLSETPPPAMAPSWLRAPG
jgi:Tol biopolymer transport system component